MKFILIPEDLYSQLKQVMNVEVTDTARLEHVRNLARQIIEFKVPEPIYLMDDEDLHNVIDHLRNERDDLERAVKMAEDASNKIRKAARNMSDAAAMADVVSRRYSH